ncbi:MAG TPA: excinuclease ABC subunit UvrC [Chloroflexi bacterium]|nr:excinuclease ABC subunit UvrC [Chloroflexota bacterium]
MNGHIPEKVAQKLDTLPTAPGCYQMLDATGRVLYVGKAVVLRNRVRSYFHASANHTPRTQALVAEIADITWWVTKTELEALVLENELIKRYQPHYNVRLKDDKTFPYIKVNWQDDFPKIQVVRRMRKDGARYFGPYTSSRACYETLDALRRVFPYLDCDREITGQDRRPCLYYHIKLCGGPCIGAQTREEYRQTIQQLMHFLEGDSDKVLRQLQEQMTRAAENLQFELAAIYRDRLQSAQRIAEQQKIVLASLEDLDYVAVAQDARTGDTAVQVFMVRHGRMVGRDSFMLEGAEVFQLQEQNEVHAPTESDSAEADPTGAGQLAVVIGAFIQQFYDNAAFVPPLILLQALPPDHAVLAEWLADHRGGKVELRVPRRGDKVKVLELAQENAAEFLRVQQATRAADTNRQTEALTELQSVLHLETAPTRIECYDISTLQGTNTVGSMVVFVKGAPAKSAYKRFKIHGKGGQGAPDDFASMREMLRRRFRRLVEPEAETDPGQRAREENESWRIAPDLVIIDGGKGQLGVAVEVLQEFGLLERIPVIGLAKREEEIFRPHAPDPVWLRRGSQALHLVQRIRDEAHRYGITYHRNLRAKEQVRSRLDDVPGVGPKRRKAILKHFDGDLARVRAATVEELMAVPGVTRKVAEQIKEAL